jgi:hypothetical protein
MLATRIRSVIAHERLLLQIGEKWMVMHEYNSPLQSKAARASLDFKP